jgi:hypothetical protein
MSIRELNMATDRNATETVATISRWLGRITATLLLAMVIMFAIGEGPPNPFHASASANLQHAAFLAVLVGCAVGCFRESLGGVLAIVGLAAFYVINFAGSGRFPGGAFPLFALPGVLFLASHFLRRKERPGEDHAGPA